MDMLNLWRLDTVVGSYKLERGVSPETADAWLAVFQKDSPDATFVVSSKRPVTAIEKTLRRMQRARKGASK